MEKSAKLTFQADLPGGRDRLREMILHVSVRCHDARRYGKVKLNKILWRADFLSFKEKQVPVTGSGYEKLAVGPAPLHIEDVLDDMLANGEIRIDERGAGGDYIEHRIASLRQPDLRYFSRIDLRFVEDSIQYYWSKSATTASELSNKTAWNVCNFTELMPYESVFLSDEKLTRAEKEKLHSLAKTRNWNSL